MTTLDQLVRLSDGNPGAITTLCTLLNEGFCGTIARIEELKLSGVQIYLAGKDYARGDLERLTIGVMQLDPELLKIWENCGYPWSEKETT
jgi:hypothetical protein